MVQKSVTFFHSFHLDSAVFFLWRSYIPYEAAKTEREWDRALRNLRESVPYIYVCIPKKVDEAY